MVICARGKRIDNICYARQEAVISNYNANVVDVNIRIAGRR